MSEKDKRYQEAFERLHNRLEMEDLKGEEALRAFVEVVHQKSATGLANYWWCGIYTIELNDGCPELILRAASSPACSPLPIQPRNGGVCCDCALLEKPIVVPDVGRYPGHVACDPGSRSEVVAPIFSRDGRMIAVIDVDDTKPDSFDWDDADWLVKFAELLSEKL